MGDDGVMRARKGYVPAQYKDKALQVEITQGYRP